MFADTLPIITVGAVNYFGFTSRFSQGGDLLTVSAAGENIRCASVVTDTTVEMTGTSFAAPAVAGLAAYLLSVEKYQTELTGNGEASQLPYNMKRLIQSLAYIRTDGTEPSIFNGVDWLDPNPCWYNSMLPKRQACCKFY
jgi:subtilisin family serine protease